MGAFIIGLMVGVLIAVYAVFGFLMLDGALKTGCDQHIIDAATETIDEDLAAELVLCDYEGPLVP